MAHFASTTSASETARLGKLAEYQILDTDPEREFDEIVQVAAKLIGTPISLVSLIDRDRQWFKARYGLGATQTPREQAFCDHAIKSDDVYIVDDATKNPLFAGNPLVTGAPDIRFYAGAPLITPDKFRLGTLCVIDTKPHDGLSADHETVLALLARMVVNALESRRLTMRANHQARMMTRLAEATVEISQSLNPADIARKVTETARGLVVADAAHIQLLLPAAGGQSVFVASRSGAKDQPPPGVPWQAYGQALLSRRALKASTAHDLPVAVTTADPVKGSWIGFVIGLDKDKPAAALQLWRQYTTSFTDLETAMLTDIARVASAALERRSGAQITAASGPIRLLLSGGRHRWPPDCCPFSHARTSSRYKQAHPAPQRRPDGSSRDVWLKSVCRRRVL